MGFVHVSGKDMGKITLYALSTCIWCRKTKELLTGLNVAFDYVYVDLLRGEERSKTVEEVRRHNPDLSFPTLVIEDRCIVGYKEKEIKEALVG